MSRPIGNRYPAECIDGTWLVVEVTGLPKNGLTPARCVKSGLASRDEALLYCERGRDDEYANEQAA